MQKKLVSYDREVQNKDLDSDEEEKSNVNTYLANQNATKWSCAPVQLNVRTRSENVIGFWSGVKPIG